MLTSEYYAQVESLIRELFRSLSHFSPSEQDEVVSFLEAGEYGLAVETAYQIIIEQNKSLTQQSYDLFSELISMMDIGENVTLGRLAMQISR